MVTKHTENLECVSQLEIGQAGYLLNHPRILGHGCILRTFADNPNTDAGLFASSSNYLGTWMHSAYVRRYF